MKMDELLSHSFPKAEEEIYPMPVICILTVDDVEKSAAWYMQALGFKMIFSIPNPETHHLVFAHIRRAKYQDILLTQGASSKSTNRYGIAVTFQAWSDIDSLTQHARAHGADIVIEPHDTPWNTREVTFQDIDGYTITFTYPQKNWLK